MAVKRKRKKAVRGKKKARKAARKTKVRRKVRPKAKRKTTRAKKTRKKKVARKKVAKKRAPKRKKKKAAKRKKRRVNPAFMKALSPSDELAAVVGPKPLPRTQVVKKLWVYIKKNGLQDQRDRRMINADAKLRPIFRGKRQVSMFQMTALVSKHLR